MIASFYVSKHTLLLSLLWMILHSSILWIQPLLEIYQSFYSSTMMVYIGLRRPSSACFLYCSVSLSLIDDEEHDVMLEVTSKNKQTTAQSSTLDDENLYFHSCTAASTTAFAAIDCCDEVATISITFSLLNTSQTCPCTSTF